MALPRMRRLQSQKEPRRETRGSVGDAVSGAEWRKRRARNQCTLRLKRSVIESYEKSSGPTGTVLRPACPSPHAARTDSLGNPGPQKREGRHCSGAFTPKRKQPARSNLSGKLHDKCSRVAARLASATCCSHAAPGTSMMRARFPFRTARPVRARLYASRNLSGDVQ